MSLKSKEDHDKERAHEIEKAVMSCVAEEKPVPKEWVNEYMDLSEPKKETKPLTLSRRDVISVSTLVAMGIIRVFNIHDDHLNIIPDLKQVESVVFGILKGALQPYSDYKLNEQNT